MQKDWKYSKFVLCTEKQAWNILRATQIVIVYSWNITVLCIQHTAPESMQRYIGLRTFNFCWAAWATSCRSWALGANRKFSILTKIRRRREWRRLLITSHAYRVTRCVDVMWFIKITRLNGCDVMSLGQYITSHGYHIARTSRAK